MPQSHAECPAARRFHLKSPRTYPPRSFGSILLSLGRLLRSAHFHFGHDFGLVQRHDADGACCSIDDVSLMAFLRASLCSL